MDLVTDRLRPEDLEALRDAEANRRVLHLRPSAFTVEQAAAIEKDHMRIMGDIAGRYEIDEDEHWTVSYFTGRIQYHEDD